MLLGASFTWITPFVTPVWLVSFGVAVGLAVLGLLYGLVAAVSRPAATAIVDSVREGILLPMFYMGVVLSALALVLWGLAAVNVPVVPANAVLSSATRIFSVGPKDETVVIPAATRDVPVPFHFRPSELRSFTLTSDQPLTVRTRLAEGAGPDGAVRLSAQMPFEWRRFGLSEKPFGDNVHEWTATNVSDKPAALKIHTVTGIEYPQVVVIPWTAAIMVAFLAIYLAIRALFPKIAAIAVTTTKESMGQPAYYVALAFGTCLLLAAIYIPYNTFGEDVKVLKDSGLTLIMLLSILVATLSASVSVADEIEGRTALTLLSKPITRRDFILGKFLGIIAPVLLMFVMLGFLFLVTVSYKMVYDSRETSQQMPSWQVCYAEMISIVPGLVLAFFEAVTLASISVAISTRLPMLANLIICAMVYVLGHLVPLLVNSSVGEFEAVQFVGRLIATVFPVLENYNIQAAVAAGVPVPLDYLGWALLYCLNYCTIAMLAALWMFDSRDLA